MLIKTTDLTSRALDCADCKNPITGKTEPADGWQLDDGRTVCGHCCAQDLRAAVNLYPGDQVDVPEVLC